jgi:arsenical pump membrane protein
VWSAFALVAGLLLVGAAVAKEGVFAAAGALLARAPCTPAVLLASLLGAEAIVAALLNLDTAVVFMTPVLLHAARQRRLAEGPFLYGSVFVANSGSLLLPGSNLTNLIVVPRDQLSGAAFAARLAPAWAVAVVVTIAFVEILFRRGLVARRRARPRGIALRLGPGLAGAVGAAVLVLVLAQPALPVLGLGIATALYAHLPARELVVAAKPRLLVGVLALAVVLGTAGRAVGAIGSLARVTGRWQSSVLAAGASVVANNLPAAAILSSHPPTHPAALLLGLDLGPNLAVSGSLSAILWLHVARANEARPSVLRYSLLGLGLVPLTLAAALAVTAV